MDENKKLASAIVAAGLTLWIGVGLTKSGIRQTGKALDILLGKIEKVTKAAAESKTD